MPKQKHSPAQPDFQAFRPSTSPIASEHRLKSCGTKMAIICEGVRYLHAAHHFEGYAIDDTGMVCVRAFIRGPGAEPIVVRRRDQEAERCERLVKSNDGISVRPPCCSIAGFEQDVSRRKQGYGPVLKFSEGVCGGDVPLIAFIPKCYQADGIEKDLRCWRRAHGWCSLCRSATSLSPERYRSDNTA